MSATKDENIFHSQKICSVGAFQERKRLGGGRERVIAEVWCGGGVQWWKRNEKERK